MLVAPTAVVAQTMDCSTATSCEECVVSRCAYTTVGTCLDSCDLVATETDSSECFSSRALAGQSAAEICQQANNGSDLVVVQADDEMVPVVNDTNVVITGESHPCNSLRGCEPCLTATSMDCAWTAKSCQPSCVIADAACYTPQSFLNMTGSEICAVAVADESSEEGDAAATAGDRVVADSAAPDVLQGLKIAFLLGLLVAGVMV